MDDHPEGEDFDVNVDIEVEFDDDDDDRGRRRDYRADNFFGADGPFGANGPFGAQGPFGPDGPFGAGGLFGPGGLFGQNRKRNRRSASRAMRPARRGRMFGPGELRLVMLAMFAEEPRHGYEFIKALEEMTDGAYSPSPGIVYPTLQMLSDEGLIEERESEDARKLYQATEAGMAELEDRADEIEALFERLGRKAERAKPKGSPDLFRSLGNLAAVISNKAKHGGLNKMDSDQVVDLIDDLARKIERL
ncbi:PadR family transcriptional regulator [Aurantiacibacter aquimixticola]|uniref:PadR family transcriptional regulator n=2 Tax=Aurantiacibacter aquimixticola TaxID=1958945 RepID=A0A419RWS9_9SPHN|nr:PadR family transcriptional regulator [Aurantiacibacter aquimixticola]